MVISSEKEEREPKDEPTERQEDVDPAPKNSESAFTIDVLAGGWSWKNIFFCSKARLRFLCISLCMVSLEASCSALVAHTSKTLTNTVDCVSALVDVAALSINIWIEILKKGQNSSQTTLILDLVGCTISMTCLSALSTWSLDEANIEMTTGSLPQAQFERISHVNFMVAGSVFSLCCLMVTTSSFWAMFNDLFPNGFSKDDGLNVAASMAHTIVDVFETSCVLITSLTMWIRTKANPPKTEHDRIEAAKELQQMDALGSEIISFFTLFSVGFIIFEALKVMKLFREQSETAATSKARTLATKVPPGGMYGAVSVQ